jgi:hypothetical protein
VIDRGLASSYFVDAICFENGQYLAFGESLDAVAQAALDVAIAVARGGLGRAVHGCGAAGFAAFVVVPVRWRAGESSTLTQRELVDLGNLPARDSPAGLIYRRRSGGEARSSTSGEPRSFTP